MKRWPQVLCLTASRLWLIGPFQLIQVAAIEQTSTDAESVCLLYAGHHACFCELLTWRMTCVMRAKNWEQSWCWQGIKNRFLCLWLLAFWWRFWRRMGKGISVGFFWRCYWPIGIWYLFKKWLTLTGTLFPIFVLSPNSRSPNFSKFLDVLYSQLNNNNNNVNISLPFGIFCHLIPVAPFPLFKNYIYPNCLVL